MGGGTSESQAPPVRVTLATETFVLQS